MKCCTSGRAIYTVNIDGSGSTKIVAEGGGQYPAWSPDGEHIAFKGEEGIYVMNIDGNEVVQLAANGSYPAWSADGTQIAFTTERDGNQEIYVMNADGSNQINLTNHPADDGGYSFEPRGGPSWGP